MSEHADVKIDVKNNMKQAAESVLDPKPVRPTPLNVPKHVPMQATEKTKPPFVPKPHLTDKPFAEHEGLATLARENRIRNGEARNKRTRQR